MSAPRALPPIWRSLAVLAVVLVAGLISTTMPNGWETVLAYESANSVPNAKEIAYWGTRHPGDGATDLSASLLMDPLANGIAGAAGALKRPLSAEVGYRQKLFLGDDATKEALLTVLHASKPPSIAVHGLAWHVDPVRATQSTDRSRCPAVPGFQTCSCRLGGDVRLPG